MEEISSLDSFHTDEESANADISQEEKTKAPADDLDEVDEEVPSYDGDENSAADTAAISDDIINDADTLNYSADGDTEADADADGNTAAADFEEVDANEPGIENSATADESDMLGDADMTIGDVSKPTDKSAMEVDGDDDEVQDGEQSLDAETASNNSENEKAKSKNAAEADETGDELAEADDNATEKDAANTPEEQEDKDEGAEDAEATMQDDNPNEEDGDHGGETVENVQEPEESDVCLLPDDTETQMTDAEKEQAILARENAEREDEEETKDKEKEKEKDKKSSSQSEKSASNNNNKTATNDEDDAEENEEGGTAAKGKNATRATSEANEEDVQAGESESTEDSAANKTIIAWIVPAVHECQQCAEEKSCGFRYKVAKDKDSADKDDESATNAADCVFKYLCSQECCDEFLKSNSGKYFIRRKKFLVEELSNNNKEEGSKEAEHTCLQCLKECACKYFFKQDEDCYYVCNDQCFKDLNAEQPDKFKLKRHAIRVRDMNIPKSDADASTNLSGDSQVRARTAAEAEAARLARVESFVRRCEECTREITLGDKNLQWETMDFCNEICLGKYQRSIGSNCKTCQGEVPDQALGKYCVRFGFDVRQFCCASCLNDFKKGLKTCSCCQKDISSANEGFLAPVGDKEQFKDFCSQTCMRHYDVMCNPKKKIRTDTCTVCNNDKTVRVEILLDDKEHNFCSNPCFSAFKFVSNIVADQCGMCCKYFERKGADSFTLYKENNSKLFCSRICMNVYIIVNRRIVSCQWCKVKKYDLDMIIRDNVFVCSLNCLTLYGVSINAFSRALIKCDNCNTAATPQYHLTMSDASMRNFCTHECVMQFQNQFGLAPLTLENDANATTTTQSQQQQQRIVSKFPTPTDGAPFPTGLPKRIKPRQPLNNQPKQLKLPTKIVNSANNKSGTSTLPVISAVSSLASGESETLIGNVTVRRGRVRGRKPESPQPLTSLADDASNDSSKATSSTTTMSGRSARLRKLNARSPSPDENHSNGKQRVVEKIVRETETKIITVPPYPPKVRNVQTSCKPQQANCSVQAQVKTVDMGTQTDKDYSNKVLIPVPVPIYVPQPMYMYSAPFPVPVPIPLPIPVPIFIPTTRNSAQGILKEIKKIQDKMPADPFEAELLMMAEMVAEEKANSDSDSGPDDELKNETRVMTINFGDTNNTGSNTNHNNSVNTVEVSTSNHAYGDDVLQMALKMATGEYDQPTVDLETAMTTSTITNPPPDMVEHHDPGTYVHADVQQMQQQHIIDSPRSANRGRKRSGGNSRSPGKRQRMPDMDGLQQQSLGLGQHILVPQQQQQQPQQQPSQQQDADIQQINEKPDAGMCLKYMFGVNAWRQWVATKNADIEKSSMRRRPFKTDFLQMTADELNYSLCLFIKEVRKPNGAEYAPDTIYYLVLGLQQYLYENARIDNIFTDPYYERFTDCLDEVARKFSVLYNDSQYIVTRVEEEHLWECKQLGAHSPHVLLSTLMFFNTKHFNLTTVEEHMQLSFSHIMKHWKRSNQNNKSQASRSVLLRFYPPQTGLDANPRKKKLYEQQENGENPLRCPVRLYEFYLSKCPESVKTRNDVFYLLPERSCVPDSPVWYSTQALSQEALQKMLHRVKMVKEINIALLTS